MPAGGIRIEHCCALQLTGGLSKGLAWMTMDQEYINRFRFRSVTVRQRMLQGLQAAGVGVYEGFIGTELSPCRFLPSTSLQRQHATRSLDLS